MKLRDVALLPVMLGLAVSLASCAKDCGSEAVPTAAAGETKAAPTSARVSLEIDGARRGDLAVTATPAALESLLPAGVKPLSTWKHLHVVSKSGRFVLASHPGADYVGQVPVLYTDARGRPAFAMVTPRPDGALPGTAAEMRTRPLTMQLADVAQVALWIDSVPKAEAAPAGTLVLRHRNQQAEFGAADFQPLLGAPAVFAGHGAIERPDGTATAEPGGDGKAEAEAARGNPSGGRQKREQGKSAGAPMGWSVVELLRKTVAQDTELLGIRIAPAEGEPVTVEPKWWTDKNRFLGIRVNRKGEFVVHGYVLGERASMEVEVRGVTLVEAMGVGGGRHGAGSAEGKGGDKGDGSGEGKGGGKGDGSGEGKGGGPTRAK